MKRTDFFDSNTNRKQYDDELIETLYQELHKLAHARMCKLGPGQTLQTTALVHEAYLRLRAGKQARWNGRRHFFGAAAMAMRDIVIESARRKVALKRGGDQVQVDLPIAVIADAGTLPAAELIDLNRALVSMKQERPEAAELVMLHFFAGLPLHEVAEVMGLSRSTLMRRWRFARAWMYDQMTAAG